ncbi:hypothetical protein LSAT2_022622 [Lamellibrachia satsuma]|nr:hypothetical protein LSAT2_022622 [Lamellibrachia satsuma]
MVPELTSFGCYNADSSLFRSSASRDPGRRLSIIYLTACRLVQTLIIDWQSSQPASGLGSATEYLGCLLSVQVTGVQLTDIERECGRVHLREIPRWPVGRVSADTRAIAHSTVQPDI